jgi:murein DD-endopeptidase MepM/ murein hydrolase activator NlpD
MAAFIRPVKSGKISDDFNDHKKRKSVNPGTDYAVASGTKVVAVADGVVSGVTTSINGAGGRMVWLAFPNGMSADYLHLSRINVKKGQKVKQGEVLGLSGASGLGKERGYGAHLHFSMRKGTKHVQGKGNFDYEAFLKSQPADKPVAVVPPTQVAPPVAPAKPVEAVVAAPAPVVAPPAPTKPINRKTVSKGSKGADVKYLQKKLEIAADGDFGPNTDKAVRAFQSSKGLVVDGVVGAKTWAAIG